MEEKKIVEINDDELENVIGGIDIPEPSIIFDDGATSWNQEVQTPSAGTYTLYFGKK